MKQQEKDRLHIKKQNRRNRKLIWDILKPIFTVQILALPLLIMGVISLTVRPQAPVEVTYVDCHWDGTTHKALVLYTEADGPFMLPYYMREDFLEDVENGTIKPGDRLTVTWYRWPLRRGVATATCGDRVYGDLKDWKAHQKKDARFAFLLSGLIFVIGLTSAGYICAQERKEFADIRRLKQKYKSRLPDAAEPWDKDAQRK